MSDAGLDPEGDASGSLEGVLRELALLQEELDKINDEISDKVLLIEQECNHLRRPFYERRSTVISKLPGFWKAVLLGHPVASGYINETDEDMLEHLLQIDLQDCADVKSGFSITFTFDSTRNPYFTNDVLVKHFKYSDDALTTTGDIPQWKEGMEPRPDAAWTEVGDKRLPPGLDIRFFSWFVEEEVHAPGNHDELAEVIKDDIWPNPYKYFMPEEGTEVYESPGREDGRPEGYDSEIAALENGSDASDDDGDDVSDDGDDDDVGLQEDDQQDD